MLQEGALAQVCLLWTHYSFVPPLLLVRAMLTLLAWLDIIQLIRYNTRNRCSYYFCIILFFRLICQLFILNTVKAHNIPAFHLFSNTNCMYHVSFIREYWCVLYYKIWRQIESWNDFSNAACNRLFVTLSFDIVFLKIILSYNFVAQQVM